MNTSTYSQKTRNLPRVSPSPALIQRKCACDGKQDCDECRGKQPTIQRSTIHPGPVDEASANRWRAGAAGVGLPAPVRSIMESRFGADFSTVRVHADERAGRAAVDLGAKAFTTGHDIYFAPGHYQPGSGRGLGLLAHELTHVVQQRNGRVTPVSGGSTVMASHGHLEAEAERAEQALQGSLAAVPVRHAAAPGTYQRDISETFAAMRAAAAGGIEAVANYVVSIAAATDGVIRRLNDLRIMLRNLGRPIVLSPAVVSAMSSIYHALRGAAPSWLPVPDFRFMPVAQRAAPLLVIGGVAITVEVLIIITAFILVMLWLLSRLDPATRRAQDRAVEDLIERIKEAARPRPVPVPEPERPPERRPEPEKKPELEPRPRPPIPPLGPDIDLDDEERDRRGCRTFSIAMKFGRYPCHADYAKTFSGVRREFRVIPPRGLLPADFDARDRTGALYEVKTGYRWILNEKPKPPWDQRKREVIDRFQTQASWQQDIANACGRPLFWYCNEKAVAEYLNGFVEPEVRYRAFDCDHDSDHLW